MINQDGAVANFRLTGKQLKQLDLAIRAAYPNFDSLKECLLFEMDVRANEIVRYQTNLKQQIADVLEWAEASGRMRELVVALRSHTPGNPVLNEAAELIFPGQAIQEDDLEKIVSANPDLFSDPTAFRNAMIRAEWAICRVERPLGRAQGTGFLIGPDLVITNHHVKDDAYGKFDSQPRDVRFRFGFREDEESDGGRVCRLASSESWLVHESPATQFDYAIVRLDEPVGDLPIAEFNNAPSRGWLKLKESDVQPGQALFILQHPGGDTLKMANGGLRRIDGCWLEYEVNTEPGSSGSPVFDNRWRLVGLHSRHGKEAINKGIATNQILANLPEDLRAKLT